MSVLLSAITGGLLVHWGERVVGRAAARVAGILFALSLVEVSLARQIRMYSLYQPLTLLALYLLYQFWESGKPRWGLGAGAAMLVALGTHELASTLALLYIPVVLRQGERRIRALWLLPVVILGLLYKALERATAFGLTGGASTVVEPQHVGATARAMFRASIGSDPLGFGRERLGWPAFVTLACVAAAVGGALALVGTRGRPLLTRIAALFALSGALASAACYHMGIALAILALVVLQRSDLFPGRAGGRALLGAGLTALGAGVAWEAAICRAGYGPRDALIGMILEPWRLAHLMLWPPAIGIAALAGALTIAARCWRGTQASGEQFLLLAVGWLVTSRGILGDRIALRYVADLLPMWELLAGCAVVGAIAWIARQARGPTARWAPVAAGAAMLVALVMLPGTSPARTLGYIARRHAPPTGRSDRLDVDVPDLRGACAWLEPRLRAGDRVAATDWLTTSCYLGRVDAWIRTEEYGWETIVVDGVTRDCYIGAQLLPDVAAANAYAAGGRVWIVAGAEELFGTATPYAPEMRNWILGLRPAFVASDRATRVCLLEPVRR